MKGEEKLHAVYAASPRLCPADRRADAGGSVFAGFLSGAKILIREISDNTFGIYVMHPAVLEYLQIRGINSTSVNNIIGISLLALGCFVICNIAAALLRRIPVVGRYLC